jgi:hypothetical protein
VKPAESSATSQSEGHFLSALVRNPMKRFVPFSQIENALAEKSAGMRAAAAAWTSAP